MAKGGIVFPTVGMSYKARGGWTAHILGLMPGNGPYKFFGSVPEKDRQLHTWTSDGIWCAEDPGDELDLVKEIGATVRDVDLRAAAEEYFYENQSIMNTTQAFAFSWVKTDDASENTIRERAAWCNAFLSCIDPLLKALSVASEDDDE